MLKNKVNIQVLTRLTGVLELYLNLFSEVKRFRVPKWAFSLKILVRVASYGPLNWPIEWRKQTSHIINNITHWTKYFVTSSMATMHLIKVQSSLLLTPEEDEIIFILDWVVGLVIVYNWRLIKLFGKSRLVCLRELPAETLLLWTWSTSPSSLLLF